ncbi:odorant receptor 67a [Melanaphis sacchari]|uniref:odorant receptor 67a n=1 Tax=Melanaphis sacchari TaxID=742174 RepID=UPI000DC12E35|nr:odorant receptor 67a [Melanaphis sacchari]
MNSKNNFNGRPVALNLSTYKQLGFYQLLDPKGPHFYGCHFYRTVLKIFLLIVQFIVIFGVIGFFVEIEDIDASNSKSNSFELIIILTNCSLSSLKMYTLISNTKIIWDLFDLTCIDFLKCSQHSELITEKFVKRCKTSTRITKWIACSFLIGLVLWVMGPFIANEEYTASNVNHRYQNIINIKFPVTVKTYNDYYFVFYLMEVAVGFCIVYGSVLVDAFLMSFCWIISARYQSVTKAFAIFGHNNQLSSPKEIYKDFKSIIIDHQNVYLKMKSFYDVVRPITLIHVFAYSCSLIMYSYVIVTIFHSKESYIIAEIMKIVMTVSNVTIEVFIFCYLFELINSKKEDVNFGLYSCNWTGMDIKFKRLLLMSMKMNNTNRLKLKATPDVTINRPFFANVIHTCFKIVSVLIQTQSNE